MVNILKRRKIDATKGPILSQLITFAIPIAVGGFIQTLFNAADMMVLGRFASSIQVAAIGATTTIINLLVNTCIGLSTGAQVVISQTIGEKDGERIRKAVNTTVWISIILGVLVTLLSVLFSEKLLVMTNCPEECFYDSVVYMKIYFASTPAMMIYNYGASVIRSSGDSERPLYYLIAAGALNVVLNFILCIVLPQKVMAVAIATLASQVLGAVLVVTHLLRMEGPCRLRLKGFLPDGGMLARMMIIGIPNALNSSLFSISNLQIQSAINSHGPSTTAGNAAVSSIEGFIGCFNNAIGTAALTFVGQNYGAKNTERIKETVLKSMLLATVVGIVVGNLFVLFGRPMLRLFLPEDAVAVEIGMIRIKYLMRVYFILMISGALANTLNAFGYSSVSMATSIITVLGLRVVWMEFVYPNFLTYENLIICYAISWALKCLSTGAFLLLISPKVFKKLRAAKAAATGGETGLGAENGATLKTEKEEAAETETEAVSEAGSDIALQTAGEVGPKTESEVVS